MRKHLYTILLAAFAVWVAMLLHVDPAHVYAQSIGSGNGIEGQGGSSSGSGCSTSGTAILKGNNSGGCANAVSGTDYSPATSGTAILKGNGSGSFANAVSGTDYAPATSGNAILSGSGAGGFANVTIGSNLTFSAGTLSATGGGATPFLNASATEVYAGFL